MERVYLHMELDSFHPTLTSKSLIPSLSLSPYDPFTVNGGRKKHLQKSSSLNRFWDEEIISALDPLNKARGFGNSMICVSGH